MCDTGEDKFFYEKRKCCRDNYFLKMTAWKGKIPKYG